MTRQIIIFISIIIFFSCNDNDLDDMSRRNENWAFWIDSITGESSWVPVGPETTLKDGRYTLFYTNGKVYEKGKLKDGKNKDTIYCFDLNENIIEYILIKPDTIIHYYLNDGPYNAYFQNCKILEIGIVKNHERGNGWTRYFKNGNIEWNEKLENSTGLTLRYHDNGQILDSTNQINGKGHGQVKHWYKNGQIEEITNWDHGIQNGAFETFYENGNPKQKGNYVNGKREGEVGSWHENGQQEFIHMYKNNLREGDTKDWYSNGTLKKTATFILGQKNGKVSEYYENGKVRGEGFCRAGKQVGIWLWYHENGKLMETDTYVDGQLINVVK
jgi:antitoxin component YwqK of YwqJK toxin-antitoxin module